MGYCPSQDWDRYYDGLDAEAEAEMMWWRRHADDVLRVVTAHLPQVNLRKTSPVELVDLCAEVVRQVYDRTIDPATGEEAPRSAQQRDHGEEKKRAMFASPNTALWEAKKLLWHATKVPDNNRLIWKAYELINDVIGQINGADHDSADQTKQQVSSSDRPARDRTQSLDRRRSE